MAIIGRTTTNIGPEGKATSGDLSGDEYMVLVRSKDVSARVAAASRVEAPLGALLAFAQDARAEVRMAVASNHGIGRTTTVIAHLADDKNVDVVRALVDNPTVPRDAIEKVALSGPKVLRTYARERLEA
jgi:hypothetical protein